MFGWYFRWYVFSRQLITSLGYCKLWINFRFFVSNAKSKIVFRLWYVETCWSYHPASTSGWVKIHQFQRKFEVKYRATRQLDPFPHVSNSSSNWIGVAAIVLATAVTGRSRAAAGCYRYCRAASDSPLWTVNNDVESFVATMNHWLLCSQRSPMCFPPWCSLDYKPN